MHKCITVGNILANQSKRRIFNYLLFIFCPPQSRTNFLILAVQLIIEYSLKDIGFVHSKSSISLVYFSPLNFANSAKQILIGQYFFLS